MLRRVEKKEIKVPAHIDYLSDLREFVTQIGRQNGFSDKLINAFKLAVDEAATNIIRHAYRDTEGLITLRAFVKKESLTLSIVDQGTYFDPQRVKDPDLNRYIDIGKKGGLGIFIMRKLMDEIDYRKTEDGNELRITKYDDADRKRKFLHSAVSSIPFTIKVKYFLRTIAVVSVMIAVTYVYFYLKTDDVVTDSFVATTRATSAQIVAQISGQRANEFDVPVFVNQIYNAYIEQVSKICLEDSTGLIQDSSNDAEVMLPYNRPANTKDIGTGIYAFKMDGVGEVYEIESQILINETNRIYGKVHIVFPFESAKAEIATRRLDYLKLALFIFALSNGGVALLIYLVMNPLRKLSEWVTNLGQGADEHEMEMQKGSEIGEIAQAFSGITQKLRESEKSLADQERLQKEMQLAQEIQQTLLPMEFPKLDGYGISSYYEAAKEVGGDYYDFVEVDKDTLGIAVADVSGKGVPGSLVMTMIRTALRTEARGMKDAAKVLSRVNAFVTNDIKKGMFVTIFYLILDSKKRSINYASAGHNPMILYRASTEKTYYLNPKGFPIGVKLPEKDYFDKTIESDTIKLTKDDVLLVYTDGITEAMNSTRELYGEERLQDVLRKNGHLQIEDFVERLKDGIYSFTEGSPQYDDITLVGIKEESTREEDELRRARQAHLLISDGRSIKDACDEVNLSTYAYYNKYKKVFEDKGVDAFEISEEETSVEAKHVSIEDKTKLFDVIRNHPEFGASRIKDELYTEAYNHCDLTETQIYEELVRNRLNTRALREAFVNRARYNRARMKPPGTPMMTLDGQVIIRKPEMPRHGESESEIPEPDSRTYGQPTRADRVPFPPFETPAEDKDAVPPVLPSDESRVDSATTDSGDSTTASVGEIVAESYITEFEEDFEETSDELSGDDTSLILEDNAVSAAPETDGEDSLVEDDDDSFSFEDLFGINTDRTSVQTAEEIEDNANEVEDAPSDVAFAPVEAIDHEEVGAENETSDIEEILEDHNNGLTADEANVEQVPADPDEEETILTVSSVGELLAAEAAFEEYDDFDETSEEEESEGTEIITDGESVPVTADLSETDAQVLDSPESEPETTNQSELISHIEELLESEPHGAEALEPEAEAEALNPPEIELETTDQQELESRVEEFLESGFEGAEVHEPETETAGSPDPELETEDLLGIESYISDAQDESEEVRTSADEEEMVSFSDLIQAIDDEIVYVRDMTEASAEEASTSPVNEVNAVDDTADKEEVEASEAAPDNGRDKQDKEMSLINGIRYYKNNDYENAIKEFKNVIDTHPDYKEAHSILGNAYFRNKMYKEAATAYQRVKEIDPEDVTAYENMGVIYANRGDYEKAVKEWEKVLELSPDRTDIEEKIRKAIRMV